MYNVHLGYLAWSESSNKHAKNDKVFGMLELDVKFGIWKMEMPNIFLGYFSLKWTIRDRFGLM